MRKLPAVEMLKTVTRSLFSKPACKMYPVRGPVLYEYTRGHIEIDTSKCILCTLCAERCPTGALEVDRDKATWEIDRLKCITCGSCVEGCPKQALSMANDYISPVTTKLKEAFRIKKSATP